MRPFYQPPSLTKLDSAGVENSAGIQGRILVVEDDSIIQHLMATMLTGAGYSVVCAGDGEAGWYALGESNFDLIITDNNMPKLSGIELVRRIRAVPLQIPVILISGELPRGIKDFNSVLTPGLALEKPFSMAQLLGHIRACLVSVSSSA